MPNPRPTQLQGITDLTVLADIKPGLIDGIFDSRSYQWRLSRVLEALDAARRATRESDVMPSPFVDGVARLRGVHFFRFAIVTGDKLATAPDSNLTIVPEDKPGIMPNSKLLLNVTFDGGWEPYIRSIWGQLGTMLDLIFCHCEDYPLAAASSHEVYMRWVRDHEVPSQFFYADSAGTAGDRTYLDRLEAQQRTGGKRPGADLRAAQLALDNPQPPQPTQAAALGALRTLRGLYGLVQFFGPPSQPGPTSPPVPLDAGWVLLRFAQDFLPDLRAWWAQGLFDPGRQFDALGAAFERERQWLMLPQWRRPSKRDRLQLDKRKLQAGILESPRPPAGRSARGALVLARVVELGGARAWLKESSSAGLISDGLTIDLADNCVACTVAITYPGLLALKVPERHLAALPAEFTQGMEARAGILGDVRINHPQQWNRPRASTSPGSQPIDLSLVHLVIQLRTCEAEGKQEEQDEKDEKDRSLLLPELAQWIAKHLPSSGPIEVLAIEPTWSRPAAAGGLPARDHFGYVDGVSQPVLAPSAGNVYWDDAVKTGELLLGWVNDRGDGPLESEWLDNGTFLVVRKIRQYIERFDAVVDRAARALAADGGAPSINEARELLRAKLMGRRTDATPLVAQRGPGVNDFDFRSDGDGAQCPFASHVRRANPRAALAGMRPPRIARRGMSYGKDGRDGNERGVLFMACNASIAEQFEVIQRWLTGGNSSGVSSAQSDPLLGVPRVGEPAAFRFIHGDQVIRVDLGDQPICKLEWGLYAFVPSMARLQDLDAPPAAPGERERPPPDLETQQERDEKRVKAEFEDDVSRFARWARLRDDNAGVEKIGRTVILGRLDFVTQVLKDPGITYSASGYGTRMANTLGASPFGQDNEGSHSGHARPFVAAVKTAIKDAVTEEQAYETAFQLVAGGLASRLAGSRTLGIPAASVDFIDLGTDLIAALCQKWFGVVFGDGLTESGSIGLTPKPVRCPGHFLAMARNVFSAYPNKKVQAVAGEQADPLKAAVAKWVADAAKSPAAPVMKAVLAAIDNGISDQEKHGTVANVMLGLPATLLGSWGKVLRAWTADRRLWQLQHELLLRPRRPADSDHPNAAPISYADAGGALRNALILTMAADPVGDGIWRTAQGTYTFDDVEVKQNDIVWLGLGSALAGARGNLAMDDYLEKAEDLLFGGIESGAPHACPGRGLAIGALLGALTALLLAGQFAPTASPTVLTLKPSS